MAAFEPAYRKLLTLEAWPGYVNDPDDHGGETVAGISRHFWPEWEGWELVDELRDAPAFIRALKESAELKRLVEEFYRSQFWTVWMAVLHEQDLATWFFQMSVNTNIKPAILAVQTEVGVDPDGIFGPKTVTAVNAHDPVAVLRVARKAAIEHYRGIVNHHPTQAKFYRGWVNRALA